MKIQGRIEVFTGLLVIVGFLQAGIMFLQWCIYRRQTREMRRQRHEMRGQRHIMYRQWKAMRGQLAQMEASGRQTDKLIEQAEKSADAANTSADAAKLNAQAVINSERPLLLVEFKKYSHPTVKGHSLFKIFAVNYGRTPARILSCSTPTEQACIFPYKELELPYPSRISELWTHKVMPPKESLEITTFYPRSDINKQRLIAAVVEGETPAAAYRIVIYGDVRYCEIGADGQNPYWTRFATSSAPGIFPILAATSSWLGHASTTK